MCSLYVEVNSASFGSKTIVFGFKAMESIDPEILDSEFSRIRRIGHVTKNFPESERASKIMGLCKVSNPHAIAR